VRKYAIIRPEPPPHVTAKTLTITNAYLGDFLVPKKRIIFYHFFPEDYLIVISTQLFESILSVPHFFFRAHPATPINTPPRRTIVTGPKPCFAISLSLSSASPEEGGIMETMKRSRRKKMTNPDILLEKDDFNGTSGNSRAYISSFYISNTHANWLNSVLHSYLPVFSKE
jgi:hypothetical protein